MNEGKINIMNSSTRNESWLLTYYRLEARGKRLVEVEADHPKATNTKTYCISYLAVDTPI